MACFHVSSLAFTTLLFLHLADAQSFNPTILQDSRDLPKVDGTFGFLYRTEDGIAHAAKGDSDGVIHGRFTYTDPTGLKVNYNYNAGSRVAPGYKPAEAPPPRQQYQRPQPQRQPQPQPQPQYEEPQEYREPPVQYNPRAEIPAEPQPRYVPRSRPAESGVRPQVRTPHQYSAQYREPVESYQPQRRTRPQYASQNELYEDYN